MSIEIIKAIPPFLKKGEMYYLLVDVYGVFAESKWYSTEEKLGFAIATNNIQWSNVEIEYDRDNGI